MKRALVALLMVSGAAMAAPAQAQTPITLGTPTYGGTGCPQGTASVTLSPDGSTLAVIYDQYAVNAGGGSPAIARASCNLAIPVNIPNGFNISIVGIDYRGFNALDAGASSNFRVEYFFSGSSGPVFNQPFAGGLVDDFTIHNNIGFASLVWSPCGADVILRVNSSILAQAPGAATAYVSVDSTDVNAAIIFGIQWAACT